MEEVARDLIAPPSEEEEESDEDEENEGELEGEKINEKGSISKYRCRILLCSFVSFLFDIFRSLLDDIQEKESKSKHQKEKVEWDSKMTAKQRDIANEDQGKSFFPRTL